jgi:hypothetical protein
MFASWSIFDISNSQIDEFTNPSPRFPENSDERAISVVDATFDHGCDILRCEQIPGKQSAIGFGAPPYPLGFLGLFAIVQPGIKLLEYLLVVGDS